MKYNLTEKQKVIARQIVKTIRAGSLNETFFASRMNDGVLCLYNDRPENFQGAIPGDISALGCLERNGLLVARIEQFGINANCTIMGSIYEAVDTDFAEDPKVPPVSELAHPHPPEIAMPLDRLRTLYPDPKKLGFLIMRFSAEKPFEGIVQVIKQTADNHGLAVVRADEHEFHSGLWENVRTFLHGCGFGIAVYERIETDEPNANVGLEVGYLMAMNKPVLLLKDRTLATTQTDLAGKLYKEFDPHNPGGTIPGLIEKWLEDYGILVTTRTPHP